MLTALFVMEGALAQTPLDVEINPLWNGYVRSGLTTVFDFDIQVREGGMVSIRLVSQDVVVEHQFQAEANSRVLLHLPFLVRKADRVQIQILLNADIVGEDLLSLNPLAPPQKLIAVSVPVENRPDLVAEHPDLIIEQIVTLPRSLAGYETVDALIISPEKTSIDRQQFWQSVLSYAATCKPLYWLGPSTSSLIQFKNLAGCGGHSVHRVDTLADALVHIENHLSSRQLPGMAELLRFDDIDGNKLAKVTESTILQIAFFLIVFLLLLVVGSRHRHAYAAVIMISLIFTGLVFALWFNRPPLIKISSWTEMSIGDQTGHFVASILVTGQSWGEHSMALPRQFGMPVSDTSYQNYRYLPNHRRQTVSQELSGNPDQLGYEGSAGWELNFPTRLLSQRSFSSAGVIRLTPPVKVSLKPQLGITNHQTSPISGIRLVTGGMRFFLPTLQPGERWTLPDTTQEWGLDQEDRLLRARLGANETGILVPYSLEDAGLINKSISSTGWLLLRTDSVNKEM